MFDHKSFSFPNVLPAGESCSERDHAHQYNKALNKFKFTLFTGMVLRLMRRLVNRPRQLFDLNTMKPDLHLRGSCYSGIQVVPIRSIIGTESRATDFDMEFHPVSEAARQRWVNVAIAYLSGQPLTPVQLIQIGDAYFVRDGHHRISISRAFGQVAVDAEVITWKASPPFPWQEKTTQKKTVFSKATP